MLKNKIWLGIILSIFLLLFSINGFAAYYKYTQESGANFYVGIADKADALEDTNEMRQIIDDLGALLFHSKRDDLYPKNGIFGGAIQIPEAGLKFGNDPENNDIAAYIAGEMMWQTKAELGIDLSLYYLKTEINTLSKVETIYGVNIIDSDELAALKFTDLADTPANYTDQAGKYVKVNAGETALEFGTPTGGAGTYLELTDTPAAYDNGKYAKSTVDGVVWDDPAGAGDMTKAVYDTDTDNIVDKAETVDDGVGNSSTAADVKDAVTKKHTQNTDTQFDFYNALVSDHTWSGDTDTQPVGETVAFGDILYLDWTTKEWFKAIASAYATARGTRIALESKTDGQTCLMLVKGYIRDDSAFDFGAIPIFLNDDTAGTCDDTAPAETGDQIFVVGEAKSADILFFDPGKDVGEI